MINVRRAADRGHANHGWLDTWHTFSFASYQDPRHMGFRNLRVINDDKVAGGAGFGMHPHRDMEIVTYVLEGAIAHKDSMGNNGTIRPGDVQRMSAGTGVYHSEFNPSKTEDLHLLQIWLLPSELGIQPGYEQKQFDASQRRGKLALVASPTGADGSVTIHADAQLFAGLFDAGQTAELGLAPGRHAWVHVARGKVEVNGQALSGGDGAAISGERAVQLRGVEDAEVLVFDLA